MTSQTSSPKTKLPWSDRVFYHIINGVPYAESLHTKYIPVLSPVDGTFLAQVPLADDSVIEKAVEAAKAAAKEWYVCSHMEHLRQLKRGNADIVDAITEVFAAERGVDQEHARSELNMECILQDHLLEAIGPSVIRETVQKLGHIKGRIVVLDVQVVTGERIVRQVLLDAVLPLLVGFAIIIKPDLKTPLGVIDYFRRAQPYFPRGVIQVLVGDETLIPRLSARVEEANKDLC